MKILFISHEASMTGAPLFLLNLCKYIRKTTKWELYFLLKRDGDLTDEFIKIGRTFTYTNRSGGVTIASRLRNKFNETDQMRRVRVTRLMIKLRKLDLDIIYSNTATNGELLDELSDLNIKVVTHVHELEWALKSFGVRNLDLVRKYSNYYVSTSASITKVIAKNLLFSGKVCEVNYFPVHEAPAAINTGNIKVSLGLPPDAFIIGAAGTVEWRKGWDLFVRLAWEVKRKKPDVKIFFVWVGKIDNKIKNELEYEVLLAGLESTVFFLGHKEEPMHYYSIFDVFCLMSREEAFGIVALENAQFRTPILCFDKAEGLAQFVKDDAGIVIPYLDTYKMAEAVMGLIADNEIRIKLGDTAYQRLKESYSIDVQGDKLIQFLNSIVHT